MKMKSMKRKKVNGKEKVKLKGKVKIKRKGKGKRNKNGEAKFKVIKPNKQTRQTKCSGEWSDLYDGVTRQRENFEDWVMLKNITMMSYLMSMTMNRKIVQMNIFKP